MFDDAELDKTIIYMLIAIIGVLSLALIFLAVKKNIYYVDENGREIDPKRRKKANRPERRKEREPEPEEEEEAEEEEADEMKSSPTKEVPLDVKAAAVSGVRVTVEVVGETNTYVIDVFPCLMGRDAETCDLILPEPAVSRRHARLVQEGSKLYVEDISEHNGTYVNKTKLPSLGRARLYDDDEITLGRAVIHIDEILY